MLSKQITIRFYEELNDFIQRDFRKKDINHYYAVKTTVRDIIESYGVPHTEPDLVLVNGHSVGFDYLPEAGDRVAVYPRFESFDIGQLTKLRSEPLRQIKFILDVHLGKLAKKLRMLGFDTLYQNDFEDQEIINISLTENRIILTRDLGILKNKSVTHGYFVRSQQPNKQLNELIQRFDLVSSVKPLSRCIDCNGQIQIVDKNKILHLLKSNTKKYYKEFYQCSNCNKVYWEGSHFHKMVKQIETLTNNLTS
jgi:uncharacterized protein with PIN domain